MNGERECAGRNAKAEPVLIKREELFTAFFYTAVPEVAKRRFITGILDNIGFVISVQIIAYADSKYCNQQQPYYPL
ncbi:hypothetical protein DXN04_29395 [Chitinophaga silvisoli]|uniref:Uncharacterized protein n=1 Tax=Chitinophaga silvisoli TaxID=2291814 RepID=A0A3E1NTJ1_9BACT|nr:hypothetical protein DXN04_29395 [Chitinophaga silvisoli]